MKYLARLLLVAVCSTSANAQVGQMCDMWSFDRERIQRIDCPVLTIDWRWVIAMTDGKVLSWTETGVGKCGMQYECGDRKGFIVKAQPGFEVQVTASGTTAFIQSSWRDGVAIEQRSLCSAGSLLPRQIHILTALGPTHIGFTKVYDCG